MKKYINAEVFKAKIMNYGRIYEGDRIPIPFYKEHCGKMFTELLRWVCEEVDDALPADVAEVRRGRWEYTKELYRDPNGTHLFYGKICSECNSVSPYDSPYCMNCGANMQQGVTLVGAKMDEVEE